MTNTTSLSASTLLAMLDVARRLAEQHMVQPLLEYVSSAVFEVVAAERCMLVLFPEDGEPEVQAARDARGTPLTHVADQMSRSVLDQVRAAIAPVIINDALDDSLLKSARSVRSLGLRSVLCVPLVARGRAIGAIYVENRSAAGKFDEESALPLALFASQVVVALENARLVEGLEATIAERTQSLQQINQQLSRQAAEMAEKNALLERLLRERDEALSTQEHLLGVIAEVSTPVLPLLPGVLALPIVGTLDSRRMEGMREQLLESISASRAAVAIIDITGVPVVDTQVAAALIAMARAARLLGCQVVLVGIRPEIAQALVGLGVVLSGLTPRATLADGLTTALALRGLSIAGTAD